MILPMSMTRFEVGATATKTKTRKKSSGFPGAAPADPQQDGKKRGAQANRQRDDRLGTLPIPHPPAE
jgi:ribosome assembly protein YihI (activator of Der GTPase)